MPMYCFTSSDGEFVHKFFSVAGRPKTVTEGGKLFVRNVICEHSKMSSVNPWPQKSCALGVGLDQIESAERASFEAGVPLTFDRKTGDAEIRDNQHRNRVLESLEMHDGDACYSQRVPK